MTWAIVFGAALALTNSLALITIRILNTSIKRQFTLIIIVVLVDGIGKLYIRAGESKRKSKVM